MDKHDLLKRIASSGYNIGFGAKKNFATYDIIENVPKTISFISMAFGIYCLAIDGISSKKASATLIIFGIMNIYISSYNEKKIKYKECGEQETNLLNETHDLYLKLKSDINPEISDYLSKLKEIEKKFYENTIPKQILFSGWYAHYKFFWEMQVNWIIEELNLSLFRDKIPLSFYLSFFLISLGFIVFIIKWSVKLIFSLHNC